MIVCNSRKFIYFHLHKCGGTSIELALEPFLSWQDLLLGSTQFGELTSDYFLQRFGLYKHSWVSDVERVCGAKMLCGNYLFATVREPISRICSLYNFVDGLVAGMEDELGIDRGALRSGYHVPAHWQWLADWAATQALVASFDISEFLRDPRLSADPAFRSQTDQLRASDGLMPVQCFRLEDQLGEMQRTLTLRFGINPQISHHNQSSFKLVRPDDLGYADVQLLRERFRDDFEAFGY